MNQNEKTLIAVLNGTKDSNIAFGDLQKLLDSSRIRCPNQG